jgi:hypothetical protein
VVSRSSANTEGPRPTMRRTLYPPILCAKLYRRGQPRTMLFGSRCTSSLSSLISTRRGTSAKAERGGLVCGPVIFLEFTSSVVPSRKMSKATGWGCGFATYADLLSAREVGLLARTPLGEATAVRSIMIRSVSSAFGLFFRGLPKSQRPVWW